METKWNRPHGMLYKFARGRPRPFLLGWNGKWQSFADEDAREASARKLAEDVAEHGTEMLTFDPREWRRWLEFKEKIAGRDPMDVYREWAALSREGITGSPLTVTEAVAEFIAFRSEGKMSADTKRHFNKHLKERFAGAYGSVKLREVTPDMITKWLRTLTSSRTGRPVEAVTRKHHRKDLNIFLDYCSRVRGWIPRNPCEAVAVPAVDEEDVKLLTVDEGRSLFAKNEHNPVVARLALEAFGFLRASSAGRLQAEDIKFATRGLRMPGAEHKSRKTTFRQGHPDNLWAWLARTPEEVWSWPWWKYRNEKRVAFRVAGLSDGSENRLRKTCISAHLAWLKNPPLTSYLAQHRHTSTTSIYEGTMDEADGKAWFQIGPRFVP